MCSDAAWELLHSLIRDPSRASAVSASEWLCSLSSLAAELMSMSADDWAACLSAADAAGRLLCPLLDLFCLVVVVVIWNSALISSAQ